MAATKYFREQFGQAGVHFVERFLEAGTGFTVDFLDRAFEGVQRFFQIIILRIQIHFTLGLNTVFINRGEVNRAQALNTFGNACQLFLPAVGICLFRHIVEHIF